MPLLRQRRFPRSRTSVHAAREFALETLTDWGCTDRLDDIRLCVSELATNALLHGVPPGREYCVSLSLDGAVICLAVRDSGDRSILPRELASRTVEGDDCSGRGLLLVQALADDIGATEHVVGKTVWAIFKVACPSRQITEARR
ncbi:ATP-binding protein [Streptomyces sp. TRM72054]|uniref:ATP-binding protein n=1 Tax=Streptomyces sp. TRM72054 TaxID=2870562 RepID=UPI001C8C9108|nr:ATP-binding protein [Streptomyces sp. TRM72054]MBX9395369.1 ATP-binding protein [Streptomyces sp. TRM72054]